jgi:hypothetical protein
MLAGLAYDFGAGQFQSADFRFSQGALRNDEIFDSALAVPGRYVGEVGRRLLQRFPQSEWLVIGNPLLPLRSGLIAGFLTHAPEWAEVVTDEAGFPLFYVLPAKMVAEDERFLLLLTAQDCDLDAEILEAVTGGAVARRHLPFSGVGTPPPRGPNGWLNGDRRLDALKLQARHALKIMAARPDWRQMPFAAYYPMHAGDVLFVAIASTLVSSSPFSRQIICSSYADIPGACGSKLETVKLKLPWISRDGSVSEADYFSRALLRLGAAADEQFIIFSRILRLYYLTPFHLIDHARFALGDSLTAFAQTLHGSDNPAHGRCAQPADPLRVLFHLNGGWKLKTYPLASMRSIIMTLKGLGVEVSVIDRPDLAETGAKIEISEDSATLKRLVEAHHIFVGVDSFPHHFARTRLGWPTIGLFGNTKPTNSDAAYQVDYQTSEGWLSCNRCGAYDGCPVFGGSECANYAPPERVVGDILAMAERVYGYR